ncbi:MAG: hypothetical protein M1434_02110 [Chloroflexi bacterium]|nr:hypothetical protein [Chloroflexota bacterium]MCL5273523.1 hypothetical protein [Chloroflexota bacterium]
MRALRLVVGAYYGTVSRQGRSIAIESQPAGAAWQCFAPAKTRTVTHLTRCRGWLDRAPGGIFGHTLHRVSKDEYHPLIRLADTLAGFIRATVEIDTPEFRAMKERGKQQGVLIEI